MKFLSTKCFILDSAKLSMQCIFSFQIHLMDPLRPSTSTQLSSKNENQSVNPSQLHQSRLGLLSQALMMIITTGFLFSETLEEFWKTK